MGRSVYVWVGRWVGVCVCARACVRYYCSNFNGGKTSHLDTFCEKSST